MEVYLSWKTRITERIAEWLALISWGAFLISAIALSFGVTWFVCKFTWFFCRFLNRSLFQAPW